LYLLKGFLY